jgi:hypothetical protein
MSISLRKNVQNFNNDKYRDNVIDMFEYAMIDKTPVKLPLRHIFTEGIYAREITCKAGTLLTSMVHRYDHPFVLSKGKLRIFDKDISELEAPFTGITKAGTRRLVYIVEDVIWTTFHATTKTSVEEIEKDILLDYKNTLIDEKKFKEVRAFVTSDYKVIEKGD